MAKPNWLREEIPPDAAPGEYGPITWPEFQALPEDVRKRRAKRVYEKTLRVIEILKAEREREEQRGSRSR
jgi:hypothetical protein